MLGMVWGTSFHHSYSKQSTRSVFPAHPLVRKLANKLTQPRYYVPWGVILGVASVFPAFLILYIRYYLDKENKRRDLLIASGEVISGVGVVEESDGEDHEVDNNQLDLTDRENLTFRYVL